MSFGTVLSAIGIGGGVLPVSSDLDLVERFRRGDRRAFDDIVVRYQHRVYTLCARWLGDPEGAEEVAQDVFFAIYRNLDGFRGESSLSTWIFRIAVNHCRNRRAWRARRGHGRTDPLHAVDDGDDRPPLEVVDERARTDGGALAHEAQALVREALAALDEDHRQVLVLRDIQDLDYEEIADILDLPRGTVKSRLHRARAELARLIARRADQEG